MTNDELADAFWRIANLVREGDSLEACWRGVLDITRQSANELFRPINLREEISSIVAQLRRVFEFAPVPVAVTCLYFGLFDRVVDGKEAAGFYVSGCAGAPPGGSEFEGEQAYFPTARFIDSTILDLIKSEAIRLGNSDATSDQREILEYAVMFGAAAVVTKFAARCLALRLPIYVGFDSGDVARIAN